MSTFALTYAEALQRYADEYLDEHPLATTNELAVWAIKSGRWEAPPDLILKRCRQDFANALRAQHILDDQGQVVRAKHAARIASQNKQQTLWGDIRSAPTKHMETAFQQRREQIVGECRQLSRDIDYYNKIRGPEKQFQLVFDFRDDIEEGKFSSSVD